MPASHAAFLPPVPRPPHDPRRYLLDARAGWRAALLDRVELRADPDPCAGPATTLQLALATGSLEPLNGSEGSFGRLVLPAHLALAPDAGVLLLDHAKGALRRFDGCDCRFLTIPHTGGLGAGARQFGDPRAIAVCGDLLLVADAGHRRIAAFGLLGYTLRGLWVPPAGMLDDPWQPVAVAAMRGRIAVADRTNGALHFLDGGGRWLAVHEGFGALSAVAFDRHGRVWAASDEADSVSVVGWPDGGRIATEDDREKLRAAAPRLPFPIGPEGVIDLAWYCVASDGRRLFDAAGNPAPADALPAPALERSGNYLSSALDSRLERCRWDRVELALTLPASTFVRVRCHTAELLKPDDEIAALPAEEWTACPLATPQASAAGTWDALIRAEPGRYLWLALDLAGGGASGPRITSIAVDFPRISLRRYLPSVYGEEPVSTDFTDRFLAVFDRGLRQIERQVDRTAWLFDPDTAPAGRGRGDVLSWLGSWVGVAPEASLPLARRRQIVKAAGSLLPMRGTKAGLKRQLEITFGLAERACRERRAWCAPCRSEPSPPWTSPELVLEHFVLRRWLFVGAGRLGDDAVLWGERIVNRSRLEGPAAHGGGAGARLGVTQLNTARDPWRDPFHVHAHRFSVFLPAWIERLPGRRRIAERLVREESPAHTAGQIEWVHPRFRVGVQAMIGFDAVVGCYPQSVHLGEAHLGKGSVLPSADGRKEPAPRGGWRIGGSAM
jgi:phage tail-like protein